MTRSQLAEERDRNARKLDRQFKGKIERLQAELYRELLDSLVDRLRVDNDGRLIFSTSNVRNANAVTALISRFMMSKAGNLVQWLINRFRDTFGLNRKYFRSFLEYRTTLDDRVLRLVMLRIGVNIESKTLIPGGYLMSVLQSQPVAIAVSQDIQTALSSKTTLTAFKKQLRDKFLGDAVQGYLERHFERFSGDVFHQYDRAVQTVYADNLDLEYAIFAGTIKDNTRDFCKARVNRIFDKETIESWNDLNWKGKIQGGNVLTDLGGYNCRHTLSWISKELAERMENKRGFVNTLNQI